MLINNHLEIKRAEEEVYRYLRRMENIPNWNYYVKAVTKVQSSVSSAEDYKQVREDDEQIFRVTKADYCKSLDIETLPGSTLQFKRRFSLTKVDHATCVLEDHLEVDTGYPSILQLFFRRQMKFAVAANLDKLKILLEQGTVTLQDGRKIELAI